MVLLVLGLALILFLLVISIFAAIRTDIIKLKIVVSRPWKFSIEIVKDKREDGIKLQNSQTAGSEDKIGTVFKKSLV